MRYIRTYESHKTLKDSPLNEGILSKLFKNVKSKFSIEMSKRLGGSAKKVMNLMDKYEENLKSLLDEKNVKLLAIIELDKAKREGSDVEEELNQAVEANKESDEIYKEKKKLLKEKFDLEFNKIVKEEDNEEIKHFIRLQKILLGEKMLNYEMEYIENKMGITDKDIKSSEMLTNLIKGKKEQMESIKGMRNKIEEEGFDNKEGNIGTKEFKPGEEITYYMVDDMDKEPKDRVERKAKVSDKQTNKEGEQLKDDTEFLRVITDGSGDKGILLKKSQIKAEKSEEEIKKEEEESKKQDKEVSDAESDI